MDTPESSHIDADVLKKDLEDIRNTLIEMCEAKPTS